MPNRLIRDGFVDSESVNAISDWAHRVYSNLLVRSDDAGRFDGRLEILRSQLFPLGTKRRAEDFKKAIDELASPLSEEGGTLPALLIRYEHAGKPFLQLTKVMRCSPCVTSRFPWSDGDHIIEYAKRSTRDGVKEFVLTSLVNGMLNGSVSHAEGIEGLASGSPESGTGTGTKSGTGAGTDASAPPDKKKASRPKGMPWKQTAK